MDVDQIQARLDNIHRRLVKGVVVSPKDVATKHDVEFLLKRLAATESEAVRLLGVLQKLKFGEKRSPDVRLKQVRERVNAVLEADEISKALDRDPQKLRRLKD